LKTDEDGLQPVIFGAPVLTYLDVCSAPVLADHQFRHILIRFGSLATV